MVARTREEWLALKAPAISSTESPALFGMSPYMSAYELGLSKQSGKVDDAYDNERIRWGRRLQDSIAQGLADDYRVAIEGFENEFRGHPTVHRMGTSLDYIVWSADDTENELGKLFAAHGPGVLEIKNVDALVHKKWPENECPEHIEIQVQHQLEVMGLEWAAIGVLVGGNTTAIYTRKRDTEVGALLCKRVKEFWENLAKGVLPPPVMPQDASIIIAMNQYAEPGKVLDLQDDTVFEALLTEYSNAGDVEREVGKARHSMKAKILSRIGDAERVLVNGFSVSASMVASAEVKPYTRGAYRNLRVTVMRGERGKGQ